MTTGLHTVRDITCSKCGALLGWKYGASSRGQSWPNADDRCLTLHRQSVRVHAEIQGECDRATPTACTRALMDALAYRRDASSSRRRSSVS